MGKYGETVTFKENEKSKNQGKYGSIVTIGENKEAPKSFKQDVVDSFTSSELTPFEQGLGQSLRGAATGLGSFGDIFSLARMPGQAAGGFLTSLLGLPEAPKTQQILPTSEQAKSLFDYLSNEQFQPSSRSEQVLQEIPERAIRAVPAALFGPGALYSALAGESLGLAGKEGAQRLGGGETAQTLADLILGVLGGGLSSAYQRRSGIAPKGLESIEQYGKQKGFTENELTPILQAEKKGKYLSKTARKSSKDAELFEQIEQKFGNVFSEINEQASKLPALNESQEDKFVKALSSFMDDLKKTIQPSKDKEQMIEFLDKSISNVYKNGIKPEELINYYRDINQTVNWNAVKNGKKKLDQVKSLIKSTLNEIDPSLGKQFEDSNKLYSLFKKTEKLLKPETYDKFLDMQKYIGLPLSIGQYAMTGNPAGILSEISVLGTREIARKAIMSPKFQNLNKNFIKAINNNSPKLAKHFSDLMEKEINQ